MTELILASRSPRRRQLLAHFGLAFDVIGADIDESRLAHESAGQLAMRLAMHKAETVHALFAGDCRVLGGDTVVALADQVMGKPQNREHAIAMLSKLSGATHSVFSGVAVVHGTQRRALLSETRVTFKPLHRAVIERYCDTDDPWDKAGAYGIQGDAGQFVAQLEGSYSGVIGLPLWHVHQLLMRPQPEVCNGKP